MVSVNNAKMAAKLRQLMAEKESLHGIGAGDTLAALIGAQFDGLDVVFTSGFSVTACLYGKPDAEILSRTENVMACAAITQVIDKPLIADIDTAYGNAASAVNAVHEFERAGVAGVIIEDQVSPKLCPISVSNTQKVIPIEEAAGRIKAVVENKLNPDTVIVARSDDEDFDSIIERAKAYKAAGADVVQLSYLAYKTPEGAKKAAEIIDHPQSFVVVGMTDEWTSEMIMAMKPKLVQYPLVPIEAAFKAMWDACQYISDKHQVLGIDVPMVPHNAIVDLVNMKEVERLNNAYSKFFYNK